VKLKDGSLRFALTAESNRQTVASLTTSRSIAEQEEASKLLIAEYEQQIKPIFIEDMDLDTPNIGASTSPKSGVRPVTEEMISL
jgi:hypothetical protein